MFFNKGAIIITLLGCALCCHAEDKKPCLIFEGGAGENLAIDLDKYNRITFGEDKMLLSNSDNPAVKLELLYTAYNRFRVGDSKPSTAVEEISESPVKLLYNSAEQTLTLGSEAGEAYTVGIFSMKGVLMHSATLTAGEAVSLQTLGSGVYVAVAVNSTSTHTLKFVK